MASKRCFTIPVGDAELFEQDLGPNEFEYFKKHIEAFKTMWNEQSVKDKINFIDEFFTYSEMFGYIRDFPSKVEIKKEIFNETKMFLIDNFAAGKLSTAKKLVFQIALISENRDRFSHHGFGSMSRAKDPFYNIDTRQTFRAFFGEPQHSNIYQKAIVTMGLYTKFGGAVCRLLRRWVEDDVIHAAPITKPAEKVQTSNSSTKKKADSQRCPADCDEDWVLIKSPDGEEKSGVVPKTPQPAVKEKSGKKAPEQTNQPRRDGNTGTKESVAGKKKEETKPSGATLIGADAIGGSYLFKLNSPSGAEDVMKFFGHQESKSETKSSSTENRSKPASKKPSSGESGPKKPVGKCHHCSGCLQIELRPKTYKKCAWCKGKNTSFYCSKKCQIEDWQTRHREEHMKRGNVGCYG